MHILRDKRRWPGFKDATPIATTKAATEAATGARPGGITPVRAGAATTLAPVSEPRPDRRDMVAHPAHGAAARGRGSSYLFSTFNTSPC